MKNSCYRKIVFLIKSLWQNFKKSKTVPFVKCLYGLPFVASTTLGPHIVVMRPFLCTGRLLGDGARLWGVSYRAVMIDNRVVPLYSM